MVLSHLVLDTVESSPPVRKRVTKERLNKSGTYDSIDRVGAHERLDAVERRLDAIERDPVEHRLATMIGRLDALEQEVSAARAAPMQNDPSQKDPSQKDPSQNEGRWPELSGDQCRLEASVWEAPLVVGLVVDGASDESSVGASVFTWLLVLLNVTVQGMLMWIFNWQSDLTSESMTQDDVKDLAEWRRNAAHDVRNMNSLTFTSLAELVCNGDKSLLSSASQQAAYEDLTQYLGQDETVPLHFRPGPLMAIIAIAVWTLTVVRELQASLRLIDAILHMPTTASVRSIGKHGVFAKFHPEANEVVLVGISPSRKALTVLLQMLRIALYPCSGSNPGQAA
jgi:hypothetical protein